VKSQFRPEITCQIGRNFGLAGNGGDSASYTALDALRDHILPQTFGRIGVTYAVAGDTAANHDDASQLSARTPIDRFCAWGDGPATSWPQISAENAVG
jgi:hypothetical protein